jgi:cytochrome c-type biogenesis protein CcmH/NrfG
MKTDQAEGQRFATGCSFVLVAIGVIILAFGLGIYSTYRQYKADPEGFETQLQQEYQQLEENALKNQKAKIENQMDTQPSTE